MRCTSSRQALLVDPDEEFLELGGPVPAVQGTDHLAGGHVQSGEQAGRAEAHIGVAAPTRGAHHHRQDRLEAVECLDLAVGSDQGAVSAFRLARFPGPPAVMAGPAAVAEAHEHVLSTNVPAVGEAVEIDLANWQSEPRPKIDIGFEAAVGPSGTDALIERVAGWGSQLPCPGDPSFIRTASVTIDHSGILPTAHAVTRLKQAIGRIERSIDPPEAATPVLTTEVRL
jgi:hypothetical protein